jgi:hypothetical protein
LIKVPRDREIKVQGAAVSAQDDDITAGILQLALRATAFGLIVNRGWMAKKIVS